MRKRCQLVAGAAFTLAAAVIQSPHQAKCLSPDVRLGNRLELAEGTRAMVPPSMGFTDAQVESERMYVCKYSDDWEPCGPRSRWSGQDLTMDRHCPVDKCCSLLAMQWARIGYWCTSNPALCIIRNDSLSYGNCNCKNFKDKCPSNSSCHEDNGTYCSCNKGYFRLGDKCVYNDCQDDLCKPGTCSMVGDRAVCSCPPDMIAKGNSCVCKAGKVLLKNQCVPDKCKSDSCSPGICFNNFSSMGYACFCPRGWESRNGKCLQHVCAQNPCKPGKCLLSLDKKTGICKCPRGYEAHNQFDSSLKCVRVDECYTNNKCGMADAVKSCRSVGNSTECICQNGYELQGTPAVCKSKTANKCATGICGAPAAVKLCSAEENKPHRCVCNDNYKLKTIEGHGQKCEEKRTCPKSACGTSGVVRCTMHSGNINCHCAPGYHREIMPGTQKCVMNLGEPPASTDTVAPLGDKLPVSDSMDTQTGAPPQGPVATPSSQAGPASAKELETVKNDADARSKENNLADVPAPSARESEPQPGKQPPPENNNESNVMGPGAQRDHANPGGNAKPRKRTSPNHEPPSTKVTSPNQQPPSTKVTSPIQEAPLTKVTPPFAIAREETVQASSEGYESGNMSSTEESDPARHYDKTLKKASSIPLSDYRVRKHPQESQVPSPSDIPATRAQPPQEPKEPVSQAVDIERIPDVLPSLEAPSDEPEAVDVDENKPEDQTAQGQRGVNKSTGRPASDQSSQRSNENSGKQEQDEQGMGSTVFIAGGAALAVLGLMVAGGYYFTSLPESTPDALTVEEDDTEEWGEEVDSANDQDPEESRDHAIHPSTPSWA